MVNTGWFEAALPLTVTTTRPVSAPTGTTTFNWVEEAFETNASFPLNVTLFSLNVGLKNFPVIETSVFGNAEVGLTAMTSAIGVSSSSSQENKTGNKSA